MGPAAALCLFSWAVAAFDHTHEALTELLHHYVFEGRVAYTSLKGSDGETQLDAYLRSLQQVHPEEYQTFSPSQRLAFWINAYNAHTLKKVVLLWPMGNLKGVGDAWAQSSLPLALENQRAWSLNGVEDVLLPRWKDPRAYFALSCGTRGCPALRTTAYQAAALDGQLDDATQKFWSNAALNRVDAAARTAVLAPLFKRHKTAFEAPPLWQFLAPYLDANVYAAVMARPQPLKVSYAEMDWRINGY